MSMNFKGMPEDTLIDLVTKGIGPGNTAAASLEMQRRSTAVQAELISVVGQLDANIQREAKASAALQEQAIQVQTELIKAVGILDADTKESSAALVEVERRQAAQTAALVDFARETSNQTDKLITLTKWLIWLTVALGVLAIVQLAVMLIKKGA